MHRTTNPRRRIGPRVPSRSGSGWSLRGGNPGVTHFKAASLTADSLQGRLAHCSAAASVTWSGPCVGSRAECSGGSPYLRKRPVGIFHWQSLPLSWRITPRASRLATAGAHTRVRLTVQTIPRSASSPLATYTASRLAGEARDHAGDPMREPAQPGDEENENDVHGRVSFR